MPFRQIEKYKCDKDECMSSEHNPPTLVYLQPGKWEWTCPQCGYSQVLIVPKVTL